MHRMDNVHIARETVLSLQDASTMAILLGACVGVTLITHDAMNNQSPLALDDSVPSLEHFKRSGNTSRLSVPNIN